MVGMKTLTKEQAAAELAEAHYAMDNGLQSVHRMVADDEEDAREPIKLLEVNQDTLPAGIVPIYFGTLPHGRIPYPYVIVEVTPEEYQELKQGLLHLPTGWRQDRSYQRPQPLSAAA